MKKIISILLLLAMLTTIIPMSVLTAGATTVTPNGDWTGSTGNEKNYDLSWYGDAETTAPTVNPGNYVFVDGAYYQVLGYESKTFEIADAADLAGLAKLTNVATTAARTNPYFANCTFNITAATIDLRDHYWTPIASNYNSNASACQIFGGHLKGANTADEYGIVTIANMIIDNKQSGGDKSYGVGLIGMQGGGSIQNITLTGAKITSNTGFCAGSFVGYQYGPALDEYDHTNSKNAERCCTTYKNLSSDAVIDKEYAAGNYVRNATGGIVGAANSGYYVTTAIFENCTFTGSIISKEANAAGIIGMAETGGGKGGGVFVELYNCKVESEITVTGATKDDTIGIGGLIGATKANIIANSCEVDVEIIATINVGSTKVATGGMIGVGDGINALTVRNEATEKYSDHENRTISFTDCKFEGAVTANKNNIGMYVGNLTAATDVKLDNCKVEGDASNLQNISWIGEATNVTLYNTNSSSDFLTKFYDGAETTPAITNADTEDIVTNLGIQMHDDGDRMRVSAQIRGSDYAAAGFEFFVTYTDGTKGIVSTKVNTKDVTVCYTSIMEDGDSKDAEQGYRWIVFVIEGFEGKTNISIDFVAKVKKDQTVTYSAPTHLVGG